jgi:hypothetical protein
MLQDLPQHEIELRHELEQGLSAITRVTDRVDMKQRMAATQTIVDNLQHRVSDWKDLELTELGELLLVDVLTVTTSDDRCETHVFLFHDMLLCLVDDPSPAPPGHFSAHASSASSALVLQHHFRLLDVLFATPSIHTGTSSALHP